MSSTSAQFATSSRMGLFEPFHQIGMWEDSFKVDNGLNSGLPTVIQVETKPENKFLQSQHTSHDPLGNSRNTHEANNVSDKVQRRQAQNREAARKSRLRKKAYVQQLETSRIKLAQLQQELDRVRQQGLFAVGVLDTRAIGLSVAVNSGIVAFEMQYRIWVEEQEKINFELRNLFQTHASDLELQMLVERGLAHYYDLFRMKADAAKADVFYLMSGMWRTPVERFFLWIGGFRPSELVNVIMPQLDPLVDQQLVSVGNLRQSSQQAEDALSQGMEKLQQSLAMGITVDPAGVLSYSSEIASPLEALEIFVNQADHLRQQTLQQMSRILTTRQAARGLLALGDYFQRLRALSSLWASCPREPT